MRKIERIFITISLFAVVTVTASAIWHNLNKPEQGAVQSIPTTKYGAFLATQHAVFVNDFDTAVKLTENLRDVEYPIVQNTIYLSDFLAGKMPLDAHLLKNEKSMPARLIYDAYLIQNDNWKELYNRHKSDDSALAAPLRIWAAVANDKQADALKFIEKLPTNSSWKSFVRGQIYAEKKDYKKAAENFMAVDPSFLNINDYLYIMSFYIHHDMIDKASKLLKEFTSMPGGMFMLSYDNIPEWSRFGGYKNQLAFSLVQNVSHTQIMMYSDLAMLLLRFAQITAPEFATSNNVMDYYLGNFFYHNTGNWQKHFDNISQDSPYYLFGLLRSADKTGKIDKLQEAQKKHPLFVPAVNKLVAHHIQHGNKSDALRIIRHAMNDEHLNDAGRAFFAKGRAQINFAFGDLDAAQSDLHKVSEALALDAEILSLQAKIWAMQNRELDNAYEYAMKLVKHNPADVLAWDTLGLVVAKREGADAALDVLERVGEVSTTCSSLFEHLGDIYASKGDVNKAIDSYVRAIELSDDGLTVIPLIEKKIRKLK